MHSHARMHARTHARTHALIYTHSITDSYALSSHLSSEGGGGEGRRREGQRPVEANEQTDSRNQGNKDSIKQWRKEVRL